MNRHSTPKRSDVATICCSSPSDGSLAYRSSRSRSAERAHIWVSADPVAVAGFAVTVHSAPSGVAPASVIAGAAPR